jgi:hypothetical protein
VDVCVVFTVREKGKSQDNPDKETSTDKVQSENKRIKKKIWVGAKFSALDQSSSGARSVSYRMGTGSLS